MSIHPLKNKYMSHPVSIVRRGAAIAISLGMLLPLHLQAAVIDTMVEPSESEATATYSINLTLDKSQYLAASCERPVISVTVTDDATGQPISGAYVEFVTNSTDLPYNNDFFWDSLAPGPYYYGYVRTNDSGFASATAKPICTVGNGAAYAFVFPPSGPNNNGQGAGPKYFTFVAGPGPGLSVEGGSGSCLEQYYDLPRHCPYLDYTY